MSEEKKGFFQGLFGREEEEQDDSSISSEQFKGKSTAEALEVRFAENYSNLDGKFVFCDNLRVFFNYLSSLQSENKWNNIFSWNNELRTFFKSHQFPFNEELLIEESDAAISECFALIADEGVIMLTPNQATHRRLTTFPQNHIIVAYKKSLIENLDEALVKFQIAFQDKLPSLIDLDPDCKICKANHSRVLNATGNANVFVFYIDSLDFE